MDSSDFSEWISSVTQLSGLFMTGTDTSVGKTWVGTRLLKHLQQRGLNITARKPVESGWPEDTSQLHTTDAYQLAACTQQQTQLSLICPNRFKAPLSPPRAAQLEGQTLSIDQLATQCRTGADTEHFLYVEGAGGFYSPLAQDGLNADLAVALDLPVILVTEDRVGCINHVLLTVEAIQKRELTLTGIILNAIHPQPEGMDNMRELQALLKVPVLRVEN